MTYILVITKADGRELTTLTDFADDVATIADVRHLLSARQPKIVILRGSGEAAVRLGDWTWREGMPCWTPEPGGGG